MISSNGVAARTNVVLIMADNMGWSDLGCFGGEIATPHLDALAARGTKLTQFYNTARCSPSRVSLLTGLDPHQTGIGELVVDDLPAGYRGSLNDHCATVAQTLRDARYATIMSGKWHLSSNRQHPDASWPIRRGFADFWGTIAGAGSYFQPTTLHEGEQPLNADDLGEDFYYTDAIAARAAAGIRDAAATGMSFFSYVAFTAPHWPLHARAEDVAAVAGAYDEGWDVIRSRRYARQRELGVISAQTPMSERDPEVPAWDDEPEQDWQRRRMTVYAAQIVAMDRAVGEILEAVEETGQRDNTLILFLSDNGGCAEDFPVENADPVRSQRQMVPPAAPDGSALKIGNTPEIDPGGVDTWTSYGQSWANVSNTPFRKYKQWVHEGGIATPLIVSWPAGGVVAEEMVDAPHQLTDIVPTILAATGAPAPTERRGVRLPMTRGINMLPALRGNEPTDHPLFWEHIGNAAFATSSGNSFVTTRVNGSGTTSAPTGASPLIWPVSTRIESLR